MYKVARCLRSSALAAAVAGTSASNSALGDAFRQVQQVWNIDFRNGPATTSTLTFNDEPDPSAPIFHVLELDGSVAPAMRVGSADAATPASSPSDEAAQHYQYTVNEENCGISREVARRMMTAMVTHNAMDKIMLEAQRQGRISFYMTMFGEEAAVIGAAAGLSDRDELFMQYRESGILTYRGYTIREFISQCMGNCECDLKGRQMPIHYGSKRLHAQMISSPLATQIPHGAGAGYAIRLENEALLKHQPPGSSLLSVPDARICATFFGEGAASEGDFHAGVNFASTVGSHTLFFVRNNGYAISTPTHDQYSGDGMLGRAVGYGVAAARVDGLDALAVYHTTRKARELILTKNQPVLVEALTYRLSHHSTSDDSTAYRSRDEIQHFAETFSPMERFERFLAARGWWGAEESAAIAAAVRQEVLEELRRQETLPSWPVDTMCDDVYATLTPSLLREKEELMRHYAAHKAQYDQEKL